MVAINIEEIFVFADYGQEHRSPKWKKDHSTKGFTIIRIDKEGNVSNFRKDFVKAENMTDFRLLHIK